MMLRRFAVALCLFTMVMAADEPPAPPDPAALAANWWLYFQLDKTQPKQFTGRITAARDSLKALGRSLGDTDKQKSIATINGLLERYEKLITAEAPAPSSLPAPKPTYTQEQLLGVTIQELRLQRSQTQQLSQTIKSLQAEL